MIHRSSLKERSHKSLRAEPPILAFALFLRTFLSQWIKIIFAWRIRESSLSSVTGSSVYRLIACINQNIFLKMICLDLVSAYRYGASFESRVCRLTSWVYPPLNSYLLPQQASWSSTVGVGCLVRNGKLEATIREYCFGWNAMVEGMQNQWMVLYWSVQCTCKFVSS